MINGTGKTTQPPQPKQGKTRSGLEPKAQSRSQLANSSRTLARPGRAKVAMRKE
jgi:hypothetical protein